MFSLCLHLALAVYEPPGSQLWVQSSVRQMRSERHRADTGTQQHYLMEHKSPITHFPSHRHCYRDVHTHTWQEQPEPLTHAATHTFLHSTPVVTLSCPTISRHVHNVPQPLSSKISGPGAPTYLEQVRQLLSGQFLKLIDAEAALTALPSCKGEEGGDHCLDGRLQLSQWLCCH